MFLLAFYAFLRIGEITVRALTDDTSKLIQVQDITVLDDRIGQAKSAQICIKHWKSQIQVLPFTITINAQVGTLCAVLALKNFITLRGSTPGPLFNKNKLPITRSQFNIVLNKLQNVQVWIQRESNHIVSVLAQRQQRPGLGFRKTK